MTEELRVIQLDLCYTLDREQLRAFLGQNGLKLEEDVQAAFGVVDLQDRLRACGCAAGGLLKCFAVDGELRGQNILGLLVSRLVQDRFSAGFYDLFIVSRARNKALFANCGFVPLAETAELVLLENCANGPESFAERLFLPGDEKRVMGALVMNCNPFTLGHQALVEFAAGQCDGVHVFVLEEERSLFPSGDRLELVRAGTAHLPNVRVHLSGPYMISASTFPTYFLKEGENAAQLQSELDITLFARRIAPALHITRRYAGEEPLDQITAVYNRTMARLLPRYGIQFCQIPRREREGIIISATRVRRLLKEKGVCDEVLALVPETTARYLKEHF